MLVSKTWVTRNYNKNRPSGMEQETKMWKGYFLLGFIPLYISNYQTIYR